MHRGMSGREVETTGVGRCDDEDEVDEAIEMRARESGETAETAVNTMSTGLTGLRAQHSTAQHVLSAPRHSSRGGSTTQRRAHGT